MNIKELIEKYFQAETSIEEEAQLRAYFMGRQVDPSLEHWRPLFQTLETERQQALGRDFDQKLLRQLNAEAKIIRLSPMRKLMRVAAVGAVLLVSFFFLSRPQEAKATAINWEKYEITDPDQAYQETKKALELLSRKLNKGSKKAVKGVSKTEKISKYVN